MRSRPRLGRMAPPAAASLWLLAASAAEAQMKVEQGHEIARTWCSGCHVVESGGARVMIAPMAQMFLFGTEIDYATGLIESGFKFSNPNVTEACGCGESVSLTPAEAPEKAQ